ncbi:MAG: hypothetical protein U1E70_20155 [Acetobacteraceae bacterium]
MRNILLKSIVIIAAKNRRSGRNKNMRSSDRKRYRPGGLCCRMIRRCYLLPALTAVVLVVSSPRIAAAVQYDFLSVSGNNIAGNGAVSTFSSNQGNGTIGASHVFSSAAGVGGFDNNNAAIYPSQFTTLFPGTGLVQGHLAMTVYNYSSTVTFNLGGYKGYLPELVFGLWNTTDEVALPAYNVQLLINNVLTAPSMVQVLGTQDNQTQVSGRHKMQLNTATGDITAPVLNNPNGIHTDALFFDGIPVGTQAIVVSAHLPPLNDIGDGVGYYFAERVPEPPAPALFAAAALLTLAVRWGLRQQRLGSPLAPRR